MQQGSRQELATDPAVTCQQEVLLVHVGGHHTFCSPACVGFGRYARCRCTGCSGGASPCRPALSKLNPPHSKTSKTSNLVVLQAPAESEEEEEYEPAPKPKAKVKGKKAAAPKVGPGMAQGTALGCGIPTLGLQLCLGCA